MQVIYSPRYEIDLGSHVWPTSKYRLVARHLRQHDIIPDAAFVEPQPCGWDDLALVHAPEYLEKVKTNALTEEEIRTLELPWNPGLADAFRLMTGGTCTAAALALRDGLCAHLGGGLHHAFPGHGEGFCLFNDVAVAIRVLQRDGRISRAAIVDCDVHQGNGTAAIFEQDPTVFTFSIHQQHNYPIFKPRGDLDIGLSDGARDAEYLGRLRPVLDRIMSSPPELVVYLAGADPFEHDRLGGLALTRDGLRARDRAVFDAAHSAGVPVSVVLAGGYAENVGDTVAIHADTIVEMLKYKR